MTGPLFERLVEENERMVRALALSYCRDEHAAEDIVQDAFLRAYRWLNGLDAPPEARSWLYAITRHAALDYLRARKRRHAEELKVDVPAPVKEDDADLIKRVMAAVDELREDYRQIILLRYIEKLSYSEIAKSLDMTPTAVGEKLHRVRKLIMEKFAT